MRRGGFVSSVAFLAFSLLLLAFFARAPESSITGPAHAIDGDSIMIGGEEIRIKGMDAPELRQMCQEAGQEFPCGRRAAAVMKRWLGRGPVFCYGSERDRYNRRLALCRVNGVDIGRDMVLQGLAVDYGLYPDEEREAARALRGIWAGNFERPEDYRRRLRESGGQRRRPLANSKEPRQAGDAQVPPAESRP